MPDNPATLQSPVYRASTYESGTERLERRMEVPLPRLKPGALGASHSKAAGGDSAARAHPHIDTSHAWEKKALGTLIRTCLKEGSPPSAPRN